MYAEDPQATKMYPNWEKIKQSIMRPKSLHNKALTSNRLDTSRPTMERLIKIFGVRSIIGEKRIRMKTPAKPILTRWMKVTNAGLIKGSFINHL